jgi:hypothetical protein
MCVGQHAQMRTELNEESEWSEERAELSQKLFHTRRPMSTSIRPLTQRLLSIE